MADLLRIGVPEIAIRLRRSRQARRLVLRVAGDGSTPIMTVPASAPLGEVRRFALEQESWLRSSLAARPPLAFLVPGAPLPVAGRDLVLAIGGPSRIDAAADTLVLAGPTWKLPAQAAAFLREEARAACVAAVDRYAALAGRAPGQIRLRDPRGRWGSCSSRGDLMFSWRLAMAPPPVLDYVVAHEVAHLVELNHSRRFWDVVARIAPDHGGARAWLRAHGGNLHRYDFRAVPAAGAKVA